MEEREHAKELSGDFKEDKEKAGLEGRSDVRSVPKGEEGREEQKRQVFKNRSEICTYVISTMV